MENKTQNGMDDGAFSRNLGSRWSGNISPRFSFHMHLPFMGACLVAICLALAVALPQAPGYIGVFHIAVLKSLDIFGIQTTAAQSYAIVLWAISILPSTIMGFFFLWREGIAFREVVKLEEEIVEGKLEEMEGITEAKKQIKMVIRIVYRAFGEPFFLKF